ncbi:MAG: hypothetical protein RJA09_287 [Pseudomonadota bacterium]
MTPDQAAAHLLQGGLVGLPTETVYGLAANADDPAAVARIFEAKGRPKNHPLIVHLAGTTPTEWRAGINHYAVDVPAFAWRLVEGFWPGPLTLILPRRPGVGEAAAGGQGSIGLRCPSHPQAQAVLQAAAALGVRGVAAPSANRFGRVSPTTAAHVHSEFDNLVASGQLLVVDGGPCEVGIESTIVDASRGRLVLMRPGMLDPAHLARVAGVPLAERDGEAPRASGTLESHYAPSARVRLMDAQQIQAALDVLGADLHHIALYTRTRVRVQGRPAGRRDMPQDASGAAHDLFAALRDLDGPPTRLIWVETPPADSAWDGVRDRLQRAAA